MHQIALLMSLLPAAWPQYPSDVRGTIGPVYANGSAYLELVLDACYQWDIRPPITRSGFEVIVAPEVRKSIACSIGTFTPVTLDLGTFVTPGEYRVIYAPRAVGFDPIPPSIFDVSVRPPPTTGGAVEIEPAYPTALETVNLHMINDDDCHRIGAVRMAGNVIRLDRVRDTSVFTCSPISRVIALGAFPPGDYRVEINGATAGGDVALDFTVAYGARSAPGDRTAPSRDLSGVWSSVNEERSTGMTFIHTRFPGAGSSDDGIIAIWYRYDDEGAPEWYWIEARAPDRVDTSFGTTYTGSIFRYSDRDPQAEGHRRIVDAAPAGTVTFTVANIFDRPLRVRAVLDGKEIRFELQRLRYPRSAFPEP